MTKDTRSGTRTTSTRPERKATAPQRDETRKEQELPDAPLPEGEYDPEDLMGESQFTSGEAGERQMYERRRAPGGPPDRDPFTTTPDSELGRRALEDATEAPAQERYEPQAVHESEMDLELETSAGPDEDFAEEELGEVEPEEEPDDRELRREEERAEQVRRAAAKR